MERIKTFSVRASATVLALACCATPAHAQGQLTEEALAERLFEEGKAAMHERRYAVACKRLAESQRIAPAGGTALLLALCFEAEGRFASAWTQYQQALAAARRDARADRVERTLERLAAISPRVTLLHIRLSAHEPSALEVSVDGTPVPPAAYDVGLPVDPGPHTIRAHRPGHAHWSTRLEVKPDTPKVWVTVGPFLPLVPPTAGERAPSRSSWQRDTATVLLAAGGAALVSTAIATGVAVSRAAKADELCPKVACADRRAVDQSTQAREAAAVATVAFTIGMTFGAGGGVLLWSAPSQKTTLGSNQVR